MAASIQSFGMSEQLSIRRPYAICRRLAWFPGTFSRHAFPKPSDLPPQASSDLSSSALRAEAAHVRWRSRFSRADNGPPAGTRCGGPSKRPQEQRSMGGMHVNAHPRGNDRTNSLWHRPTHTHPQHSPRGAHAAVCTELGVAFDWWRMCSVSDDEPGARVHAVCARDFFARRRGV